MKQYTFDFLHPPAGGRADFFVSPANSEALRWIESWPEGWGSAHALILTGPASSGKSHLAGIWAAKAKAETLNAEELTVDFIPEFSAAVVENADRVTDARALLHLLNAARERSAWLLLTSRLGARSWPFILPDLTSRLAALPHAELKEPDDALLAAALTKLLADRQLSLTPPLVNYAAQRMERSLAAAHALVAKLDEAALAEKIPLKRPLLKRVLEDGV